MDNTDVSDVESLVSLFSQSLQFAHRHRCIGVVDEVECAPALRPFARVSIEGHRCAALPQHNPARDGADIDWLSGEFEKVVGWRGANRSFRDGPPPNRR